MKSRLLMVGMAAVVAMMVAGCTKHARSSKLMKSGDRYLAERKFEEARVVYMNALRLQPSNTVALAKLGVISREDGNYLRAFQFLRRAQEINPGSATVAIEMAELLSSIGDRSNARSNAIVLLRKNAAVDRAARLVVLTSMNKPQLEEARALVEPLYKANPASRTLNEAWGHLLLRQNQVEPAIQAFQKAIQVDNKAEEAYLALASIYRVQNNPQEARKILEEATSHISPASRAGLMLVDVLMKSGATEEGKKLLQQIVDRRTSFVSAWMYQAEMDLAERKFDEALKRAEHVLTVDPSSFAAQMIRGRASLAQGKGNEAIEDFQKLSKMYPKAAEPRYQLALAQLQKGETALALQSLDSTLQLDTNNAPALFLRAQLHLRTGAAPRAIQAMTDVLASSPTNYQAYQVLAQAYMATNDWSHALDTYRKASEAFPKNPEPVFLSGMVQLQQKRTNEASQLFEKALLVAPNYAAPLVQLANIDAQKRNFAGAIQRVRTFISGKTNAELYVLLARLENLNGNPKEAEAILQRASEQNPNSGVPIQELVKLHLSQTNLAAALQVIQKGLAQRPDDLALLANGALLYDDAKRFKEAGELYDRLLQKTTNSPLALNNLAWLYSEELNQPAKALDLAKRARQISPNDPMVADTYGWILYRQGEYKLALVLLQESTPRLADNAEAQSHLGLVQYMLGDEAAARAALERAVALSSDFHERTNVLAALDILKLDPRQPDPESLKDLNQRLAEKPNDPVALSKLAQVQEAKNDFNSARKTYQQLLQSHPNSFQALLSLARLELYQSKDKAKALDYLQKLSSDQMANPSVSATVGRLLLDAGETKRAYDILGVLARDPAAPADTVMAASLAALRNGRLDDAEAGFKRLANAKNTNPGRAAETFLGLLQSYKDRRKTKLDEAALAQVLRNDPANELAKILQALALEQAGKWQEARGIYQDVLQNNPNFALASKHLASLEATYAKNDDSALTLATKARETLENDSELLVLLAQLNYRKANYPRVITLASENLRLEPKQAESLYYLGLAQVQTGDKKNGTNTLKQALTADPKHSLASQAQQVLAKAK